MPPERLSTGLTSLNADQDWLAILTVIVTEMVVAPIASITHATLYCAKVRNHVEVACDALSAWIDCEGRLPKTARRLPEAAGTVAGLDGLFRMQDEVAQRLRVRRHTRGALQLQTFSPAQSSTANAWWRSGRRSAEECWLACWPEKLPLARLVRLA